MQRKGDQSCAKGSPDNNKKTVEVYEGSKAAAENDDQKHEPERRDDSQGRAEVELGSRLFGRTEGVDENFVHIPYDA